MIKQLKVLYLVGNDTHLEGTFNTGYVTKTRFQRTLYTLGIRLTSEQYEVLSKKYADKGDEHVNYMAFLKDVDEEMKDIKIGINSCNIV